jgi:hypothetical protein
MFWIKLKVNSSGSGSKISCYHSNPDPQPCADPSSLDQAKTILLPIYIYFYFSNEVYSMYTFTAPLYQWRVFGEHCTERYSGAVYLTLI